MSGSHVETLKAELTKLIGPIGKFIIEKQIKAMGYEEADFPKEKMPELIDRVVDIGVYDKQMSKNVKTRLREATGC